MKIYNKWMIIVWLKEMKMMRLVTTKNNRKRLNVKILYTKIVCKK